MARPKSKDKRDTILSAAASVIAARGVSASTYAISTSAGIAEGTLFTYFKSKDELINTLYKELKLGLAATMLDGYPRAGSVRSRMQHIWNKYIDWGMAHPEQLAVLNKVSVYEGLTDDCRSAAMAPFAEIINLAQDARQQKLLRDIPDPFIMAMMSAQAEMTMHFIKTEPASAETYKTMGFEMYWNGIATPH